MDSLGQITEPRYRLGGKCCLFQYITEPRSTYARCTQTLYSGLSISSAFTVAGTAPVLHLFDLTHIT